MRIDKIELYHVAMPLIYPWRTAYGEDAAIHSVLCKMCSGDKHGWSESAPFAAPCYSHEFATGVFEVTKQWLAPAVVGNGFETAREINDAIQHFKGNQFARALIDTAWWTLHSAMTDTPLHELIGSQRDAIPVGADFGVMDSIDDLLASIESAANENFPRVKLKFRPGWDLPMIRAVRKAFPELPFHIDCNSGYRLSDLDLFQELDQYNLVMFEQPLNHDDVVDHASLQAAVATPVCLDESISSLQMAKQPIALGSCKYVNIKPGRVGGLSTAIAIHDLCAKHGIPCWVGGMLESSTGSAICTALATLPNFTYAADIFPSSRYYTRDLSSPAMELEMLDGIPHVRAFSTLPEPDQARLESATLATAIIQ